MKAWPKNPRAPKAEFVTADFPRYTAYGWKCLKYGIVAFGNTETEAIQLWFDAYKSEYGIA
jgi:hypothetical protein